MAQRAFFLLTLLALAASGAWAQPPAEACGPGDSLTSADTLPQSLGLNVASDDFDMTGTGCNDQGEDHVTCLTPTNACTVEASCNSGLPEVQATGLQFSVNAFLGPCTAAPASCLDASQGSGSSGPITLALTAGVEVCFVCEVGGVEDVTLELVATVGDCGVLPVDLQRYQVE